MAAPAHASQMLEKPWLVLRRLQWTRGLRAGVAVAGAMLVCHLFGKPMGWAALGGFEAILVDNGGPYRSRLETIATLLIGGAIACIFGALAGDTLWLAIMATAAFCFAATFLRVASERISSTSVIILVLYFAGFGGSSHTLDYALSASLQFVLGGLWAALLSVIFWPVDPFRPARLAVAECYRILAEFTALMLAENRENANPPAGDFQREMRIKMELARQALGTVPARVTARTVRARNLAVLLETADMLFAIAMRWTELGEIDAIPAAVAALREDAQWLGAAEYAIFSGLQHRPRDNAASYLPEGSHSLQHIRPRTLRARQQASESTLLAHLANEERDALENIQIAFEAVRAIWSGVETNAGSSSGVAARWVQLVQASEGPEVPPQFTQMWHSRWADALRANWTFDSVMMRHALRMAIVGAADIVLMRLTHVRNGSWLGMTSIIVLQPYGSGTMRRGLQRVGGTIAGGMLAALLATLIHNQAGLIAIITIASTLTLATYAVNYAWYSFFLTPTFVLMSMPHLRDWQFAEVRMANTILGALVAVTAMRLLWPEREHIALGRLLGRGAAAGANYLRAMLQFWTTEDPTRAATERQLLAPARRLSGLAINGAEESLDRMMLEPSFSPDRRASGDIHAEALAFVTYLRRLMRVATTLTAVGSGAAPVAARVAKLIDRLEAVSTAMLAGKPSPAPAPPAAADDAGTTVEEQQMRRMERQVGVLERTAAALLAKTSV